LSSYKSQKGQDRWVIKEVLQGKKGGYFLDLAAADGISESNTYVLEKKYNWTGICIEPNPSFFDQLVKTRNCICEKAVISNKVETIRFRADNGQLGGIIAEDTDNNIKTRGDQLVNATVIEMEANTLEAILEKHNAPKKIDYFSLDVEGSEERIISSFNFEKYQFGCITIERPSERVNEILFKNGYVFVRNVRFDSFYVHPDVKNAYNVVCEEFEQIPAKDW
jgi:FkbM family methyltransferase